MTSQITRVLLITSVILMAAACSSSPEIPEQEEARAYRSAEAVSQPKPATTPEAEGDEPSDPAEAPEVPKATGPVAIVNGAPIEAAEFNTEMERIAASGQVPPAMLPQLKERIVQGMIDKKLLEGAIAKQNIKITEAQIDKKLDEVKRDFERANALSQGRTGTFEQMLQRMGVNPQNLRDSLQQAIALEQVLGQRGFKPPSDDEVRAVYDANAQQFNRPESVRARHILIKVPEQATVQDWDAAKKKLDDLRVQIVDKKVDFGKLAKEHSDDTSGEQGGDLGYFPKGVMVAEFERSVFALKDGEVSQPVKTRFGWHLIKREAFHKEGPIPFDEVKELILSQLTTQKFQQALSDYLDTLRDEAQVELKLDNIS